MAGKDYKLAGCDSDEPEFSHAAAQQVGQQSDKALKKLLRTSFDFSFGVSVCPLRMVIRKTSV
jgi:hypothetical protein